MSKSKYYAVYYKTRQGFITENYDEYIKAKCKKHSNSKSFDSLIDAKIWLRNPDIFPKNKTFFAVKQGRNVGVFNSKDEFDKNTENYSGAFGKSFYTYEAAKFWFQNVDNTLVKNDNFVFKLKNKLKYLKIKLYNLFFGKNKLYNIFNELCKNKNTFKFCKIKSSGKLIVYTDASFCEKYGAGYGAAIIDLNTGSEIFIGGKNTTINDSNTAELYVIIEVLSVIDTSTISEIELFTDSQSIVEVSKQLPEYHEHGYPAKMLNNKYLWEKLYYFCTAYNIKINWIKGHSNNYYNNCCDHIANVCRK